MADARRFNIELDQFARTVGVEAAQFARTVAAEAFTTIVQATPVGNNTRWAVNRKRATKGLPPVPPGYVGGQARRNWRISIGSPSSTVLSGTDPSGQSAMTDGFGVLAQYRDLLPIWISNPLPYMDPLENGWSKQAPTGMVANAVAVVSAKYRRVS
jgi:hypothetical protein